MERSLSRSRSFDPRRIVEGLRGLARSIAASRWLRDSSYSFWIARYDRLSERDRALIRERIASFSDPPLFSVIVHEGGAPPGALVSSLESVFAQIYPHWELILCSDGSEEPRVEEALGDRGKDPRVRQASWVRALEETRGGFVALLEASDELSEHALYMVAEELQAHPEADLVYSDHDRIDPRGRRCDPWFKSEWNPDLLLSQDCIGRLAVFRASVLEGIGGLREPPEGDSYDALFRLTEGLAPVRARHVPHVLYHRRRGSLSRPSAASREGHLERCGIAARVTALGPPGHYRVRYPLPPELPLVSVIVPTRDRAELLRRCVDGVLNRTSYRPLELLVVDNRSADPETSRLFESLEPDPRVRVLDYDAPFDFAALTNWAVRRARGDLLLFLNNDTEVIHPDWLDEMVSQALRPEIGAVGAKLLYPDDTVQHGGVILGIGGVAGHAHRGLRRNGEGYHGRAALAQNFSAVTAACMVVRREVFDEVGGFDGERFGVAFNDVDLCLRIRERGYRILWTPFAELYHHESASLGLPGAPGRRERFERESRLLVERWRGLIENDPAYNPNLTLRRGDFSLAFPPRAARPWRSTSLAKR